MVYEITQCMQFTAGVSLPGQQGVWHVRAPEVQDSLRKAIGKGTLHTWSDQFPALSDTRKRSPTQKAKTRASRPWPKPLPRKRRSDAGTHQCAPDLVSSSKRQRLHLGDPAVGAKRPANLPVDASSSSSAPTRHEEQSLVQRISAGRRLPRLLELMDMTFFNIKCPQKAGRAVMHVFRPVPCETFSSQILLTSLSRWVLWNLEVDCLRRWLVTACLF